MGEILLLAALLETVELPEAPRTPQAATVVALPVVRSTLTAVAAAVAFTAIMQIYDAEEWVAGPFTAMAQSLGTMLVLEPLPLTVLAELRKQALGLVELLLLRSTHNG
jgi:hypothetical protein